MEADWFADPLGRFEGRFFDGVTWTDQVSDRGVLGADPDWSEPSMPEISSAPAISVVPVADTATASLLVESPVRVVAIIDPSLVTRHNGGARRAERPRRGRRYGVGLVAAVVVAAALALLFGPWLGDDGEPVERHEVGTSAEQDNSAVTDNAEPTSVSSTDAVAPAEAETDRNDVDAAPLADSGADSVDLGPEDAVVVASLRVMNGSVVLSELASWHRSFAAAAGVDVAPDASCWFGRLGSAAVQNAYCGPVGGSADTEWRFDVVPLVFEDRGDGLIARPIVDAAVTDTRLANGVELIGVVDPPALDPARGERDAGG